jgi:hypothetical protein
METVYIPTSILIDSFIKRKSNAVLSDHDMNRSRVIGSLLKALIVGDLKILPEYEQPIVDCNRQRPQGTEDLDQMYGIVFSDREGNLINTTSIYSLYSRDEVGY